MKKEVLMISLMTMITSKLMMKNQNRTILILLILKAFILEMIKTKSIPVPKLELISGLRTWSTGSSIQENGAKNLIKNLV